MFPKGCKKEKKKFDGHYIWSIARAVTIPASRRSRKINRGTLDTFFLLSIHIVRGYRLLGYLLLSNESFSPACPRDVNFPVSIDKCRVKNVCNSVLPSVCTGESNRSRMYRELVRSRLR